ncbi:MAG: glycosyltransferase family 4 protein [Myxococcota bacterium]
MSLAVAQVCRTFEPRVGGLEASVGGLARSLRDRGHRVRVVTLRDPALPVVPVDGVEVVWLPRVGPRRWPWAAGLGRAVQGVDVVHVHGLDGLLDQALAHAAAPVGVSTHGGYLHTPRHRRIKALWLRTGTRWSLARAGAVWFTSEADRAALAPAGADGPVLPDGVDVGRFAAVVRRPEPGRVLVLGRVDVHKGLDRLIAALAVLARRGVRRQVDVVGPEAAPGLIAALSAQARAAGVPGVRFHGARTGPALLELVARAERAVLPSRKEGFGIAAVELMAARVPLVLADIPAFRQHAGCVALVDFDDPVRGADALVAPLPPAHLDAAAARAATFGWEARAAAWEAAYAALLERRR